MSLSFCIMERAENGKFLRKCKENIIRVFFWTGIMIQVWYVKVGNGIK